MCHAKWEDLEHPHCAESLFSRANRVSVCFFAPHYRAVKLTVAETKRLPHTRLYSSLPQPLGNTGDVTVTHYQAAMSGQEEPADIRVKTGIRATQAEHPLHSPSADRRPNALFITIPATSPEASKQLSHLMVYSGRRRSPFYGTQRCNHLTDLPQETVVCDRERNQYSWQRNS